MGHIDEVSDSHNELRELILGPTYSVAQIRRHINAGMLPPPDLSFPYTAPVRLILHDVIFRLQAREDASRFSTIVEVGSYKGDSAVEMARLMKSMRRSGGFHIICIDTWLGDVAFWQWKGQWLMQGVDGRPTLYEQFLSNVFHSYNEDVIIPLPASSLVGIRYLKMLKGSATSAEKKEKSAVKFLGADFMFVDASHEYEDTLAEIRASIHIVRSGGFLAGHDYSWNWPGVVRAVNHFVNDTWPWLVKQNLAADWREFAVLVERKVLREPAACPDMTTPGPDLAPGLPRKAARRIIACAGMWMVQKL